MNCHCEIRAALVSSAVFATLVSLTLPLVFADAGLTAPAMIEGVLLAGYLFALVPLAVVIGIEAIVYCVYLKVKPLWALWGSTVANLVSTLLGVPLYMVLRLGQVHRSERANLFSLVPGFFLSVLVEYLLLLTLFTSVERRRLKGSVWIANAISSAFIAVWLIGFDRGWNLPMWFPWIAKAASR